MFWVLVLIVGVAATFIALGMYTVWFKVLSVALQVATFLVLGLTGTLLWRRLFKKR